MSREWQTNLLRILVLVPWGPAIIQSDPKRAFFLTLVFSPKNRPTSSLPREPESHPAIKSILWRTCPLSSGTLQMRSIAMGVGLRDESRDEWTTTRNDTNGIEDLVENAESVHPHENPGRAVPVSDKHPKQYERE
ncbi:hypothetical protein N7493_011824 [Penicillium malachiteum]|uniref:Uncharacterized protein n=1 Tax=Penicillium malachiteum TaxID=1324776 RepID=A0AAD6HAI7_9EURO|nr:hypothetical protein N7493_011824 [Penicillium malachiteum]